MFNRTLDEYNRLCFTRSEPSEELVTDLWKEIGPKSNSLVRKILDLPQELQDLIVEKCGGSFMCDWAFLTAMKSQSQLETADKKAGSLSKLLSQLMR
jgi:hypothetical protein